MQLANREMVLFMGMPVADVVLPTSHADAMMQRYQITPGERSMLSTAQVQELEETLTTIPQEQWRIVAGGSMTNSAYVAAHLCPNHQIHFITACAEDSYGDFIADALHHATLHPLPAQRFGSSTSRSYMGVNRAGERGFGRYFGDSMGDLSHLIPTLETLMPTAGALFMEGELLAVARDAQLVIDLCTMAKAHKVPVGLSLFGSEQVTAYREDFMHLVTHHVDYLFGNEAELAALYGREASRAAATYAQDCQSVADTILSRSSNGLVCISHGSVPATLITSKGTTRKAATPVRDLVNTSGAGDAFMGGVISALLLGRTTEEALSAGHLVASGVICQEAPQLPAPLLTSLDI